MRAVPVVAPQLPVEAALELMARWRVEHLPVVEARHCVGLVVRGDLADLEPPGDPAVPWVVGEVCRRPPPVVQVHAAGAVTAGVAVVLDGVRVVGVLTRGNDSAWSTADQRGA